MTVPEYVGVLGGGRMGAGIAHAFLIAGANVVVVEQTEEWAEGAKGRVLSSVKNSVARGAMSESEDDIAKRFSVATTPDAFANAGLVVEAVPEQFDLKLAALTGVERVVADDAWIATNTSSLSVQRLGSHLGTPSRFGGLHFFNPVPASTLVEIVVADTTSDDYAIQAAGWVKALGKTSITVRDSPGFASSRLGLAIALEAMRMVEEGVASAADIDVAMELGYKHPVGPLRTSDLVGLDVRLGIAEYLFDTIGPRFEPPQILRDLVALGDLGRKTGKGFFDYGTEGAK
ncbi:3-hydroxyacyl-CoA dehydrogenase family protein [Subtercola frigoramans]|uniref:3-hydroxybutyryl-CoA dehydrogenase n=1 Tax=Subtercola frigoramans TaxID=120298 RepID=A0ABS2L298_9MICO|nr:3-hydroxyacyl-CoA dehydrogenase family protein [Subtercola frigoramans]MBM7470885.1 3-hydroxybutyryl-CoA dehydrogenase [Subtercola frigoramans]